MALCDDKLVHACGGEGEDRADKIERKVGLGVGVNGLGRAKREQNGAAEDIGQHRDGHSEGQNVHEAVCDNFFSGVYVLFAKVDADKRRTADADEKRKRRDERDDGAAHADAASACVPLLGILPMYIRSTMLYSTLTSCESMEGTAKVQTRPLMLSDPRSFVNFKEKRLLSARGRLEKYRT